MERLMATGQNEIVSRLMNNMTNSVDHDFWYLYASKQHFFYWIVWWRERMPLGKFLVRYRKENHISHEISREIWILSDSRAHEISREFFLWDLTRYFHKGLFQPGLMVAQN